MQVMYDIPAWMVEIVEERARLTGLTPSEIIVAGLNVETSDIAAETIGWAREHGIGLTDLVQRTYHERTAVEAITSRYRTSRQNGHARL